MAKPGYLLDGWTPDDRALACATLVGRLLARQGIADGIVALDVGGKDVQVVLDPLPPGSFKLEHLAYALEAEQPSWRVRTGSGLAITLPGTASLPRGSWQPVLPVLARDTSARCVRYVPATRWRYLGVYGGTALAVAHQLLTSLLCQASPYTLALQFLDPQHLLDTVYTDAPHTVHSDSAPCETLHRLMQHTQRQLVDNLRPLLLVVVEPDPALLPLLTSLLQQAHRQPHVPLRLLLIQTRVHAHGRAAYGMLAGIVTAPSNGMVALIPHLQRWPQAGRAVALHHPVQWEGFPMTLEESDARQVIRSLPPGPYMLPPVLGADERSPAADKLATIVATAGSIPDGQASEPAPASSRTPSIAADVPAQGTSGSSLPAEPGPVWWEAELPGLITYLVSDGAITGGDQPGVTRGRLQRAFPTHLKPQARLVLLWLDAAELLAPPLKPEEPFRHPRALRSLDPTVLRTRLQATPLPVQSMETTGDR